MITIELDRTPPHYRPGEPLGGQLSWADLPADCAAIELRLFWYTSGKGDRDLEVVASYRLDSAGPVGRERFQFSSPQAPYSFSGKLISLSWALEAVPLPRGDSELLELIISPNAEEVRLGSAEPVAEESSS